MRNGGGGGKTQSAPKLPYLPATGHKRPFVGVSGGHSWTFLSTFGENRPRFLKNLSELTFEFPHEGPCVDCTGVPFDLPSKRIFKSQFTLKIISKVAAIGPKSDR